MKDIPPPASSPQPPRPSTGDTQEIPIASLQRAFKNRLYRYLAAGGVGLGAIGGGGYNVAAAQDTQKRLTTVEVEQRNLAKRVDELKVTVDAGVTETQNIKVGLKVLDAKLELLLDANGVAKSKRPKLPEPEDKP